MRLPFWRGLAAARPSELVGIVRRSSWQLRTSESVDDPLVTMPLLVNVAFLFHPLRKYVRLQLLASRPRSSPRARRVAVVTLASYNGLSSSPVRSLAT